MSCLSSQVSINFIICFDSKYAAHVVQQSLQAKSHLEGVRFAGEVHGRCDLHAKVCWHWVRVHSRDLRNKAADTLAKAGAREQWYFLVSMLTTSFESHGSRMCASSVVVGSACSLSSLRFCSWVCDHRAFCGLWFTSVSNLVSS